MLENSVLNRSAHENTTWLLVISISHATLMLKIIAQSTQRNKQNFLCKHSIQQTKIARLIKDQIFTSIECAEIDQEESSRARFTLAKVEPLRSLVQLQALQNPSLKTKVSTSHTLDLLWTNLGVLALIKTSLLVAIGFGNGRCVQEPNFQLSQKDTLSLTPLGLFIVLWKTLQGQENSKNPRITSHGSSGNNIQSQKFKPRIIARNKTELKQQYKAE